MVDTNKDSKSCNSKLGEIWITVRREEMLWPPPTTIVSVLKTYSKKDKNLPRHEQKGGGCAAGPAK